VPAFAAWPATLRRPGSAGRAGATTNLKLTFHLDHSAGADHPSFYDFADVECPDDIRQRRSSHARLKARPIAIRIQAPIKPAIR
jgi:hypothetical protein